jgi:hypothetical protein
MPTTWGDIKQEFRDSFRDVTQSFISDDELVRMLKRVFRMLDNPNGYTFQQKETTLTLTGAASYDLDTICPGWKEIITITNSLGSTTNVPIEMEFVSIKDFQLIVDRYAFTIFNNKELRFYSPTGAPLAGQLKIIYFIGYLCVDGTTHEPKDIPTSDDDYFLIPERFLDAVTEGLNWLAFRKDRSNKDDKADAFNAFSVRKNELVNLETIQVQSPRRTMRGAF